MPAHDKKPQDDKKATPFDFTNPFAAPDDDEKTKPDPKAQADERPAKASTAKADVAEPAEKPAPKPKTAKVVVDEPAAPAAPAQSKRTITELLADNSFDTDGKVRSQLAAISVKHGGDQCPPSNLVDEHDQPVG